MRSLLRQDLRWMGPFGLAGLFVFLVTHATHSVAASWVFPDNLSAAVGLLLHGLGATTLGLLAALADDVARTREYLLHRPVSPARLFWTRHGLGLAVVVAWIVLTPSLHLLGAQLLSPNAAILDHARLPMRMFQATPGLLFYAFGVWVGVSARTVLGGLLLLAGAGLPLWTLLLAAVLLTGPLPSALALVASAALAPLLLLAAFPAWRAGRDRDRPWDAPQIRRNGPTLVLVAILSGSMALTLAQLASTSGLHELYPRIGRGPAGELMLYRESLLDGRLHRADASHRLGEVLGESPQRLFFASGDAWPVEHGGQVPLDRFPHWGRPFGATVYDADYATALGYASRIFFGSDGFVHLYKVAARDGRDEDRPASARLGKGPEGRPFSARARKVSSYWNGDRVIAIHDPEDGGLWIHELEGNAAHFTRVELPGGDRFRASYTARSKRAWQEDDAPTPRLRVWGERGAYALDEGRRFQPYRPDPRDPPPETTRHQMTVHGPTSFTVVLLDEQDRPLLEHAYRPRTTLERLAALGVTLPGLLRPTLLSLASLTTPEARAHDYTRLLLDPAVPRSARWLVLGNLLVTALLAGLTHRRLGRLGMGAGRRRFWVMAVLLGGAPAFLCQRLVETRRAWMGLPEAERPAAVPVLVLADADPAAPSPAGA